MEGGTGQRTRVCGIRWGVRDGEIPLREVQVRLVRPDEGPRWNALLRAHHYIGFRKMFGRRLRHVAVWGDRWLCPARLAPRDARTRRCRSARTVMPFVDTVMPIE